MVSVGDVRYLISRIKKFTVTIGEAMKIWKWIAVGLIGLGLLEPCLADIPDWDGDPDTTSVHYSFLTDDDPVLPDTEVNSYGSVGSDLSVSSPFGSGWQDPVLNQVTRDDGTGAWDVGPNGYIIFDIPFADGSLSLYTLELVIDVIAYEAISLLPAIEVSGTELEHNLDIITEQADPPGAWMRQSWVGTVEIASSSSVSVKLTGNAGAGSVIDRVSIYTRVIPEPTAISLILLSSGFALVIKRRLS